MIKRRSKKEDINKCYIDLKGSLFSVGLFLGIPLGLFMSFINTTSFIGPLIIIFICLIYSACFIYMFKEKNNRIKKLLGVKKK